MTRPFWLSKYHIWFIYHFGAHFYDSSCAFARWNYFLFYFSFHFAAVIPYLFDIFTGFSIRFDMHTDKSFFMLFFPRSFAWFFYFGIRIIFFVSMENCCLFSAISKWLWKERDCKAAITKRAMTNRKDNLIFGQNVRKKKHTYVLRAWWLFRSIISIIFYCAIILWLLIAR